MTSLMGTCLGLDLNCSELEKGRPDAPWPPRKAGYRQGNRQFGYRCG
jgi:hypothetical protein